MANSALIYAWNPSNVESAMDTAPSSVNTSVYSQNVELQNCKNSVRYTAQFFCGRFVQSRILILLIILILYSLAGACVFHLIESKEEIDQQNLTAIRLSETRNELVERIVSIRKQNKIGGFSEQWAKETYDALVWYEKELKRETRSGGVQKWNNDDTGYWKDLILIGTSVSTIGFRLPGPSTSTFCHLIFVILLLPGIILLIISIRSTGRLLYKFYIGIGSILLRFCHCFSQSRSPEKGTLIFWSTRLSWFNLFPFFILTIIVPFFQIIIYHYTLEESSNDYISSIYTVFLSIFTIGPSVQYKTILPFLLLFSFIWLSHFSCFCHVIWREKQTFKRYLMSWLHKNKDDAIFVKLCLLQPIGQRPTIADKLMSKCANGSIYKKFLFRLLTLDEKVCMCRHLTWRGEDQMDRVRRGRLENGKYQFDASVQVDLDSDSSLI